MDHDSGRFDGRWRVLFQRTGAGSSDGLPSVYTAPHSDSDFYSDSDCSAYSHEDATSDGTSGDSNCDPDSDPDPDADHHSHTDADAHSNRDAYSVSHTDPSDPIAFTSIREAAAHGGPRSNWRCAAFGPRVLS